MSGEQTMETQVGGYWPAVLGAVAGGSKVGHLGAALAVGSVACTCVIDGEAARARKRARTDCVTRDSRTERAEGRVHRAPIHGPWHEGEERDWEGVLSREGRATAHS